MDDRVAFDIGGERLVAFADRALYWPARKRLILGDLHLGKADIFRAAGIAVPSGGTAHDLSRIEQLIDVTGAEALWVLGDMLHGAKLDGAWRVTWNAFRARHPVLAIGVVAGNHDRALSDAALDVDLLPSRVDDGPFLLTHHPRPLAGRIVIAAHRHPVVRVPGFSGRHPCFRIEPGMLIVPAFSAFSGGFLVEDRAGWIACVGGCVLAHFGAPGELDRFAQ
jgi:DNA ligase-associated metallophosphoesterase